MGGPFRGWQTQAKGATVQGCLDRALRSIGHEGPLPVGCSRTDSGVHARVYCAHVDTGIRRHPEAILRGLNAGLPSEIRVYRVGVAAAEFHARFSCQAKTYRYYLYADPVVPPAISPFTWQWRGELDFEMMVAGALAMIGDHDFAAFTTAEGRDKNTSLTLDDCRWERVGPFLMLSVTGRSFLHRMVRCIAGACIALGTGRMDMAEIRAALGGSLETPKINALPAQGLTLWEINYGGAEPSAPSGCIPKDPLFPLE